MAGRSQRRGRVIVDGFHGRFVVVQLAWLAFFLFAFAVLLFIPIIDVLAGPDSNADRGEAAASFLRLHSTLWPLLIGLFAAMGAVIVQMSHRIAGPLYQFSRVFRQVADGDLTAEVRTRKDDYLTQEAAGLVATIAALRDRIRRAQTDARRVAGELEMIVNCGRPAGAQDLAVLAKALARVEATLREFHTGAEDTARESGSSSTGQAASSSDPADGRSLGSQQGFTLVDVVLAMTIVAVLAAMSVPKYVAALEAARIVKAIGDIRTIDREVRAHLILTGCYPTSLADINHADLLDPWGRPYVYTVLSGHGGGSGSGGGSSGGGSSGGSSGKGGGGKGGGGSSGGSGSGGSSGSGGGGSGGSSATCPACGGGCSPAGGARKDRRLVPINSDFDLYSVGKDGTSAPALTAAQSQDDIVRASDGSFVGLASEY